MSERIIGFGADVPHRGPERSEQIIGFSADVSRDGPKRSGGAA